MNICWLKQKIYILENRKDLNAIFFHFTTNKQTNKHKSTIFTVGQVSRGLVLVILHGEIWL